MAGSFDFDAPDHFTAGAVGRPGQRVFYLQARQTGTLVTLKCEKEQVRALADYLERLLAALPDGGGAAADGSADLVEPVEQAFAVAALGAGYDRERDRVLIEARELQEEETDEEPAVARVALTREQTGRFVTRVRELMQAGRPLCPVCHQPMDPEGHICPRANGHVVRRRDA